MPGDTLTGNNIDSNATSYWKYVLTPCLQHNTPWAHVFGNHDDLSQEKGDRVTLMKYDQTFNLSYSVMGPKSLFGVSNYFLPIYGEHSGMSIYQELCKSEFSKSDHRELKAKFGVLIYYIM